MILLENVVIKVDILLEHYIVILNRFVGEY